MPTQTMFSKIDREFMVLFDRFRRALLDFEAFRIMWARSVTAKGVTTKDLEDGQSRAIWELLSAAENIRKHTGTKFMTVLPSDGYTNSEGTPDGIYLGQQGDKPIVALDVVNNRCHVGGEFVGSVSSLINDDWRLDGPIRTSVLR